ncbi:MAG: RNA-binding protein [Bdellovibrionaceae bacterium]|nr:RNA-binding protein [Bdellovibrionales bacterium]MCB9255123.1 RNA-binding protein [Pseudobdellovibrionaceae bacterium]
MGKKLFVGNLPYSATNAELNDWFSPFGTVESANLITDRATGRSKGFGFVEMANDDEAQAAIDELNGKEVEGRALTVNEARPKAPGRSGGGFGGGRGNFRGGSSRFGGDRSGSSRY